MYNLQDTTNKQNPINNNHKTFNLEIRTLEFSKSVMFFIKSLKSDFRVEPIINQLIRSSTSIGANYCEANDSLGKKDFLQRLRISRRECKETIYWLEILKSYYLGLETLDPLIIEATQIRNILSKIILNASV